MKVAGQRIIVFGDSLSHHGHDAAPEIWDVDQGSNRQSGQPGDLLASMLLEQGAEAVRVNARVSRSAVNFFGRENVSALLGSDQAFKPSLVIIVLGTNDLGLNPTADGQAFAKLRDFYKGLGADVWAIGPFTYNSDHLNTLAPQTIEVMKGVFGRKFIDGRPLSSQVGRSADGVHFGATAAKQTAERMLAAVVAAGPMVPTWGWVALGVTAAIGGAMLFSKRRGGKALTGSKRDRIVKRPGESDADAQRRAFDESMGREHVPRTPIVHTPGADYGSDPLGPDDNGVFRWRMVPSGDIVDEAELRRRLPQKLKGLGFCNPNQSPEAFQRCVKRQKRALAAPIDPSDIAHEHGIKRLVAKGKAEQEIRRLLLDPDPSSMDVIQDLALEHGVKLSELTKSAKAWEPQGTFFLEKDTDPLTKSDRVMWSYSRDPSGYRNQCEARVNVLQDGKRVGGWGYEDGAEHFVHRYDGSDDFCQRAITAEAWAVAKEFKRKKAKGEKLTPDDIRRVMNQDNSEPRDLFGVKPGGLGDYQRFQELLLDPDPNALDVAEDMALSEGLKLTDLSTEGTFGDKTRFGVFALAPGYRQLQSSWRVARHTANADKDLDCNISLEQYVDGKKLDWSDAPANNDLFASGLDALSKTHGTVDQCRRIAAREAWAIGKEMKRLLVDEYAPNARRTKAMKAVERAVSLRLRTHKLPAELFGQGLAGYRIGYKTTGPDGRTVIRIVTDQIAPNLATAEKWRRQLKNMDAWIEDEDGNHVPVKGALKPAKRNWFSAHATDDQLPKWLRKGGLGARDGTYDSPDEEFKTQRHEFRKLLEDDDPAVPEVIEDWAEERALKITDLTTPNYSNDHGYVRINTTHDERGGKTKHKNVVYWDVDDDVDGRFTTQIAIATDTLNTSWVLRRYRGKFTSREEAKRSAAADAWMIAKALRKLPPNSSPTVIRAEVAKILEAPQDALVKKPGLFSQLGSDKTDRDEFPTETFKELTRTANTPEELVAAKDYALEHGIKIGKLRTLYLSPIKDPDAPATRVDWKITRTHKSEGPWDNDGKDLYDVDWNVLLDNEPLHIGAGYARRASSLREIEQVVGAEAWEVANELIALRGKPFTTKKYRTRVVDALYSEAARDHLKEQPDLFGLKRRLTR